MYDLEFWKEIQKLSKINRLCTNAESIYFVRFGMILKIDKNRPRALYQLESKVFENLEFLKFVPSRMIVCEDDNYTPQELIAKAKKIIKSVKS